MASGELLKQIQAGKRLKKAETSDRSAPIVDAKPKGVGGGSFIAASPAVPSVPLGGGPPQLGSLFAGGVPQLKPVNQSAKNGRLGIPPPVPQASAPPVPLTGRSPAFPNRPAPVPDRASPIPPTRASPTPPVRASLTPPLSASPTPPIRASPTPPSRAAPVPPSRTTPALPSRTTPVLPSRATALPTFAPSGNDPDPTFNASPAPPTRTTPVPPSRLSVHAGRAPPVLPSRPVPPARVPLIPPQRNTPTPPPSSSVQDTDEAQSAPAPPVPHRLPTASSAGPPAIPKRPNGLPTRESPYSASHLPARAPPPPPRPSVVSQNPKTAHPVPPPPSRRSVNGRETELPSRARSSSESKTYIPRQPPSRSSLAPPVASEAVASGRRTASVGNLQSILNSTRSGGCELADPPAKAGSHTFPTQDFPPPRRFESRVRRYGGGRKRGSNFNLATVG